MLFGLAAAATLAVLLWPRWLEIQAETRAMVDAHQKYLTAHPGWSFPARVYSAPYDLDRPAALVVDQAKARGYVEACPPQNPGEVCPEDGAVILRGGTFPEGLQPMGNDGWTRPLALEPLELGVIIGPDAEVRWHLPLDEAPEMLLAAIVAAEDEDFREHVGVNFTALVRATWINYRGGNYSQGASTLSMQVVRNLSQRKKKTLERKLVEIASAVALDQHLGKDGVLQMYLNAPYLGQAGNLSICGFAAAAQYYYGADIRDLSLSQYATLAGILPAPGRFAPDKDPVAAQKRRDMVLGRMEEAGWDVEAALKEPVLASPHPPLPVERHPAYLQATRQWLEGHVPEETLYGAGLRVFTAMDAVAQQTSEDLLPEDVKWLQSIVGRRGEANLETAAAAIDPSTGHLVAVYGGTQETSTDFNRATQARRQPGSSFKPLVYALAFSQKGEDGKPAWRANDTVPNSWRRFEGTDGWAPRNISGEYTSTTTLAMGLAWSQNVGTASLLEALGGPKPLIAFATDLGYETGHFPEEMGLALGQGEVTPLEQARFVATVINGGRQATGAPVTRIVDADWKVRAEPEGLGQRIMTEEAAALTRGLMRLVIEYGTGGSTRWGGGRKPGFTGPAIGKTGTTDKEKDLWFIGGTPFFAGAIWLGYDQPQRIGASASDLAAPMWGWWMRALHQHYPEADFEGPIKLKRWAVCTITGRWGNGSCRLIGAPFLNDEKPHGRCPTAHPPPDPEKKKYEGLWTRRKREREAREAADQAAKDAEEGANNETDLQPDGEANGAPPGGDPPSAVPPIQDAPDEE